MQVSVEVPAKRKSKATPGALQVGDRVTFAGDVLRILPGDDPTLLVMVSSNGTKLTIKAHCFKNGAKLKGGDKTLLAGLVTRIGDEAMGDRTPVTVAVDGYVLSRVTLNLRSLSKVV